MNPLHSRSFATAPGRIFSSEITTHDDSGNITYGARVVHGFTGDGPRHQPDRVRYGLQRARAGRTGFGRSSQDLLTGPMIFRWGLIIEARQSALLLGGTGANGKKLACPLCKSRSSASAKR